MEKSAHQKLVEFWAASKAEIKFGPTSPAAVSNLEEKYAVKLPPAFRDYLLHACPISEDQCDHEVTTWWNLELIKSLKEELEDTSFLKNDPVLAKNAGQYLIFVDHMIWAWAWAICCKPGDNYGRILQLYETGEFVSNNFDEFVLAYIKYYDQGMFLPKIQ